MNKYIRNTGLLILKGLLMLNQAHADELSVGSVAPDFSLKDQNSKLQQLADYKGQWVVLYFYPKNDTPGCTTEACSFRDDIYQIKALNAQIIGVSLDDSESHEAFANKYNLPFPLLADTKAEVAKAYGSLLNLGIVKFAQRHTFIIDPNGQIQQIYRDVDPDKHSDQVIADLKTLSSKDTKDQGEKLMDNKYVGVIVIGDEILNGKRTDKHLPHALEKFKQHGLSVAWCRYVSDNEKILMRQLQQSQDDRIPVFCFGGIGATPDDTTRQAAAKAFNVDLVRHPEALALIKEKFGQMAYPNRVLMADLPDDALIIPNAFNNIPGFTLFDHHFFPGFPQMAWPMLDWVIETYYPNKHEKENEESVTIFDTPESELFELLENFAEKYPKLKVFSLPSMAKKGCIELGFRGEGLAPARALNELVSNLICRNITFTVEQVA